MPVWYILRNGGQYGPYTAQALLALMAQGGLNRQDQFLDSSTGKRYAIDKAVQKWQKSLQPRKRHTGLIVFAVIVVLIGGFIGYRLLTKTSDNLTLGASTHLVTQSVSAGGGKVSVSSGELKGFTIDVPKGAYQKDTSFDVSVREIKGQQFGSLFSAASPLISIKNGGGFAGKSMTVTIPIQKKDNEFAMGFYYDEKTGQLEGIPFLSEDNTHITLLTNHFSNILVSKTEKSNLKNAAIETGFTPGVERLEI